MSRRWPITVFLLLCGLIYWGMQEPFLHAQSSTPVSVAAVAPASAVPASSAPQSENAADEDSADDPDSEMCGVCHDDVVGAFKKTVHFTSSGWDNSTSCTNCHGDGTAHMESGDPADIVKPDRSRPHEATENCLGCHNKRHSGFTFGTAIHNLRDVSCIDCHNPHSSNDTMLRERGVDLCATCHQNILGQFRLARSHPLAGNTINGCANCHTPHGSKNVRMLRGFKNTACTDCHFEFAGPFVFNHDVSQVDGCQSCHVVHGTPNRHLLTDTRQINLCYKCHSGATTPGWHSAARFTTEKCTACHTAIHGSNTNSFFLER